MNEPVPTISEQKMTTDELQYELEKTREIARLALNSVETLRDQFAMRALTGLVQGITEMDSVGLITHRPRDCAEIAYVYADAMMEARKKEAPND